MRRLTIEAPAPRVRYLVCDCFLSNMDEAGKLLPAGDTRAEFYISFMRVEEGKPGLRGLHVISELTKEDCDDELRSLFEREDIDVVDEQFNLLAKPIEDGHAVAEMLA